MDRTIICSRVLMHMMDIEHHQVQFSEGFVDLNPTSLEYYDKKLEKIFNHPNLKEIEVGNFASIILRSKQMLEDDEKYMEHSKIITQEWFDIASLIQDMPNANLLFMETRVDGQDHMVILKLNYKYAPVMVSEEDENGKEVMRITTRQMVPGKAQGIDEAIIVNTETNQVFLIEKKFLIDGKMGFYINEQYLKGQPKMTDKEKMRIMQRAVTSIDEQYHVNQFEAPVLIKQALSDCLLENREVKPIEIASKILEKDYGAQEECLDMMKDLGVQEDDVVTVVDGVERMAKCKIITDTDIEITLTVDDYLSETNIRKVHNEDGTISLVLSNIRDVVVK